MRGGRWRKMLTKPWLLDLYCSAGGCAKGYQRAGFRVVGVDINNQPRYCGDAFVQMDAIKVLETLLCGEHITDSNGKQWRLSDFIAVHASPPCQKYTKSAKQWRAAGKEYPDLVATTRDVLRAIGKPYIIENVPGAPLINPITLNADFFGINIARTRLFETSFTLPFILLPPPRKPVKMGRPIKDGDILTPVGNFSGVPYARREMQCEWMNQHELSQAIPPVYTEWIGQHLMEIITC